MRSFISLPGKPGLGVFLWCFFIFSPAIVFSQIAIRGKVTGSDGIPLGGATIKINSSGTTLADSTGFFSLSANTGDVMEVSFVGYLTNQVVLGNDTELNIALTLAITNLEEIILVGYGTSKRKDITGAVERVTVTEFNKGNITNPIQQLQGKVAGLVITQPGGDPNGEFTVRLRGATSLEGQPPLLVIDGVAIDDFNKALATLNPSDIESFDILKDASATAIYGARGANGVIIVKTKSGKAGPVSIEYNGYTGVEKISNQLNMLNADQWREATAAIGGPGFDKGANMDWQKAITHTALSQNHFVGLNGGTDLLKFRGSLGYIKQEGIVINTAKEVLTARITVVQKSLKQKLDINYNLNTSVTKRDFLPGQNATTQVRTGGDIVFNQALSYLPVWPGYNADGSYYMPSGNSLSPLFLLKEVYSKQRENFLQVAVKADYRVSKDIYLGVLGSLSRANDVLDKFYPPVQGSPYPGEASKANFNKQAYSGNIHAGYQKKFGKQSLEITGVYEYNKFVNDGFGVTATGYLVPQLLNNNLGAATNIQPGNIFSYKNEVKLISFLGRAVYNYDDRYLLTTTLRRDGSSKFGPNKRWGFFPSLAFAWRASSEKFLQDVTWLSNLKLRMSYGSTGNQENLPANSYQLLYGPVGPYLYNGSFFQSYAVVQETNPDLKWEVRRSFNVGIDFSFLKDRINGTIDVFNDKTSDMLFLYDLPQPPFLTNQVYANAADAINRGVELRLTAALISHKKFNWTIGSNIATLQNRVTNLSGKFRGNDLFITNRHYGYVSGGGYSNAYISELKVGYPAGVFWIPQHAGLDANGHELFNNYDDHGVLTGVSGTYSDQDRIFINPTPDFTWGITNNFSYGNFDVGFFIRGVQGQKIFANSLLVYSAIINLPGSNTTPDALTNGFTEQPFPSDYWIRNGSFTRLENLSAGYNFKKIKGVSKLRLYITATNLFVITAYDGIDPEIITEGSQRYIDVNYYPKTRALMVGVNVGF